MPVAIKVDSLSKKYRLGEYQAAYGTLRETLVHVPLLLWAALAVIGHAMLSSYLGVAIAGGTSVCSATGTTTVVDADGEPLPAAAHGHHDCCCSATYALPPPQGEPAPRVDVAHAPAEQLTAQRLGAQWLAPLSRGPPLSS